MRWLIAAERMGRANAVGFNLKDGPWFRRAEKSCRFGLRRPRVRLSGRALTRGSCSTIFHRRRRERCSVVRPRNPSSASRCRSSALRRKWGEWGMRPCRNCVVISSAVGLVKRNQLSERLLGRDQRRQRRAWRRGARAFETQATASVLELFRRCPRGFKLRASFESASEFRLPTW